MTRRLERSSEDYRALPTDVLIHCIVHHADRAAIHEFANHRRLFRHKDGPPLLLVEFVSAVLLTERPARALDLPTWVCEQAYELTIDKFFRLPTGTGRNGNGTSTHPDSPLKREGPDCRYYFKVMDNEINRWRKEQDRPDPLSLELAVARIAQGCVARHCWWSFREACRELRRRWSRYQWDHPNGSIVVWLPRRLSPSRRGEWLEAHFKDVDPSRPGEQRRIQTKIDAYFGPSEVVPFDEALHSGAGPRNADSVLDLIIQAEVAEQGLVHFVALEKSMRLPELRPSIRRLGSMRVVALVHRVFENMDPDDLTARAIAKEFGLSPATYSRFAGFRRGLLDDRPPSDLALNVARIVVRFPAFRELAASLRILDRIEAIVRPDGDGDSCHDR